MCPLAWCALMCPFAQCAAKKSLPAKWWTAFEQWTKKVMNSVWTMNKDSLWAAFGQPLGSLWTAFEQWTKKVMNSVWTIYKEWQPLGSLWTAFGQLLTMSKEGDEQRLNNKQRQPLGSLWAAFGQPLNNEQRRWWTAFEQWTKTAFGQLLNNEQRQPFYPSVHTVQLNKDSLFILCAHRTVVTVYLLKCVHAKLSVETACMHASWMKGCDLQPWTNHSVICRVGQNPFFCIFGVHTVFQAGKWPYIR